jgi:hypothetical protein
MTNRKSYLLAICILILNHAGYSQLSHSGKFFIDTNRSFGYEWEAISINYPDDNDDNETIPDTLVQIDTISKNDFAKYSKKYKSKILSDTSVISRTDSSFTLKNKNFSKTYAAYRDCECSASSYQGILLPLNLYIVATTDMKNEIAYMRVIDYQTGKSFEVPGCSDPGPQKILISPKDDFLLTYDNSYYEHDNCCIFILKVNRNKSEQNYTLSHYLNLNFDGLNITEIVWINEYSFAMCVTEQQNPEDFDNSEKLHYCLNVSLLQKQK